MREQSDLLDHVADAPAERRDVLGHHVHAVDQDLAAGRIDEAVDHLQRRRLAAARRADEDADLARRDRQRKVVDGAVESPSRLP